jgi:uncharacterized protein (TIGR02246 family)
MSTDDAVAVAYSILVRLQSALDEGDPPTLTELFDDAAVLIGTGTHNHGRQAVDAYLGAVLEQPPFRWEWHEVIVFHESPGALGFTAFGEIVDSQVQQEERAPFRLTLFAVERPGGWVVRQFHGSIPSAF